MENQHRKIRGYRELTQEEIDLMNEVKDVEARTAVVMQRIIDYNSKPGSVGVDMRALAVGRTQLQTGFMWAARAVAKPQTQWDSLSNA